ncbi:polysaccharide biosynthesis C-terminal domain-containing protein [candidate division KSB1 bacterium]|nr:polysaccharide biosynthesis C-terminal domain-containing protein [candidate division KSB1 bacterium]
MTQYGLLAAVLNIILNLVMIPAFGILGAAIATTLSYFVMIVLILRLSQKHLHINWLWKKMIPVILLGMIFSWLGIIDLQELQLNFAKDAVLLLLLPALMLLLKLVSLKEIKRFALRLKGAF